MVPPSCATDETNLFLSPSAKQRRNLCFGPHQCAGHDWPVKKVIVNLPIRLKGNSKRVSCLEFVESVGGPEHGFRRCFADVTDRC